MGTIATLTRAGETAGQDQVSWVVKGPDLVVMSSPDNTLLPMYQTVTVMFGVVNRGDQDKQAQLYFALCDLTDQEAVFGLLVGESAQVDFRFFTPPNLESTDHLASYTLSGVQNDLVFTVQRISLTVKAGTERQTYRENGLGSGVFRSEELRHTATR